MTHDSYQSSEYSSCKNLTAREHAALLLRLPESGTPWLDDMIARARALDSGVQLMPTAVLGGGVHAMGDLNQLFTTGERTFYPPGDARPVAARAPQAGDIVVITEGCGGFYEAGTRAKLVEPSVSGWIACFRGLGNAKGSWKDESYDEDGNWFVTGNTFELEASHG